MVVPAPNMVSMTASTVDWDPGSHFMASGYTAVDMADSPTAVIDRMVRDIPRNTEPELMLGRNPKMMLVNPDTIAPNTNNLQKTIKFPEPMNVVY